MIESVASVVGFFATLGNSTASAPSEGMLSKNCPPSELIAASREASVAPSLNLTTNWPGTDAAVTSTLPLEVSWSSRVWAWVAPDEEKARVKATSKDSKAKVDRFKVFLLLGMHVSRYAPLGWKPIASCQWG